MPRLVLQLLTHQRVDTLPPLLESLERQTHRGWELQVLVNGAPQEAKEAILEVLQLFQTRLPMKVEVSDVNLGFAGGHQRIFEGHDAPLLMLVNDDVVLCPDYIERLVTYLNEHPQVGAVSGKLLRPDGRVDSLGLECAVTGRVVNIGEGEDFENVEGFEYTREVFGVAGTLPILRREAVVLASHDGRLFDPVFGSYKEDVELAFRFQATGWKSVVLPDVVAIHHRTFRKSRLHRGVSFHAASHSYRNHLWNLLTFYAWTDYLRQGWALLPFELSKCGFFLVTNPRVLSWTWRTTHEHWGELMRKRQYFL